MINSKSHSITKSILERLIVASFLLMFLNVSVFNQYIKVSEDTVIELSEDEEGEEENEEREGKEKELDVIKFQEFAETSLLSIDVKNIIQNSKVILNYHIEVITPPPEFIS